MKNPQKNIKGLEKKLGQLQKEYEDMDAFNQYNEVLRETLEIVKETYQQSTERGLPSVTKYSLKKSFGLAVATGVIIIGSVLGSLYISKEYVSDIRQEFTEFKEEIKTDLENNFMAGIENLAETDKERQEQRHKKIKKKEKLRRNLIIEKTTKIMEAINLRETEKLPEFLFCQEHPSINYNFIEYLTNQLLKNKGMHLTSWSFISGPSLDNNQVYSDKKDIYSMKISVASNGNDKKKLKGWLFSKCNDNDCTFTLYKTKKENCPTYSRINGLNIKSLK